jgi:hypothetical protein
MSNTVQNLDDEKTPVVAMRLVAVLDANAKPLDNFLTIRAYLQAMPLNDRVEMMLTLRSFINEEFR